MNTNIPIYRAKKIDSDDYVIFESLFKTEETLHDKEAYRAIIKIIQNTVSGWSGIVNIPITQIIDPSTLSIHFKDMLASDSDRLLPNGDKDLRIFASLNEDGRGGSTFYVGDKKIEYVSIFENFQFKGLCTTSYRSLIGLGYAQFKDYKIIGIKQ